MPGPRYGDIMSQAQLSDLDTTHFGVRIARVQLTDEKSLEEAQVYCRDNAVAMLKAEHKLNVREGRFEALNALAARLYSLGFQIELVALD